MKRLEPNEGGLRFLVNVQLKTRNRRFLRLLSEAVARIPGDVPPVESVTKVRLRARGPRGYVGLVTYSVAGGRRGNQPIDFYTGLLFDLSHKAALGVVVHELAHAWLNEHISPEESESRERDADRTAASWGFNKELEALEREAVTL